MGIRNDWWHKVFAVGDPGVQMGGDEGRESFSHPTHTWLTNYVPEGGSLLDVGCCNGHTLESFKRANKPIIYFGVDHLQELVDYCQQMYPVAQFQQSDAADLQDFQDDSYDYVLSRHVWEHLNHYSQHIMEMYRVTKKEVIIVGFLELKPDYDRLQYGVEEDGVKLPHWYNQYGRKQLEQFLQYNLPDATYEIQEEYEGLKHPIIIIRKP